MAAMQPEQATAPGAGGMLADATPGPDAATPPAPAGETAKGAEAADKEKPKPAPPPDVPAGVAALAEKTDGILLRYNDEKREWDRIDKETRLKTSDRILSIEPFRAAVDVGKVRIDLIHETEIRILSQSADAVPAIELLDGKIVVREPGAEALKVAFGRQSVTLELATDSVVGLERVNLNMYGQPVTRPMSLGILCQQGQVTVVSGAKKETLQPRGVRWSTPTARSRPPSGRRSRPGSRRSSRLPMRARSATSSPSCSTPTAPYWPRSSRRSRTSGPRSSRWPSAPQGAGGPLAADADALPRQRPGGAAGEYRGHPRRDDDGPRGLRARPLGARRGVRSRPRRLRASHADRLHPGGGVEARSLRPARRTPRARSGVDRTPRAGARHPAAAHRPRRPRLRPRQARGQGVRRLE